MRLTSTTTHPNCRVQNTTPIESDIVQFVDVSPSHSEGHAHDSFPQLSPDVDDLLALQTMTLEEDQTLTQSQPTQITDTQCAAFEETTPQDNSTPYDLQSSLLTDTQTAAESLPTTLPVQPDPLLQPTEVTDTQLAASHTSEATAQDHQPHLFNASPDASTSPNVPISSDASEQITTQPAERPARNTGQKTSALRP